MLQIGLAALERAMRAPTRVIVENAGEEGSVIVGKLLENDADSSIGYNAATGGRRTPPACPYLWTFVGLGCSRCCYGRCVDMLPFLDGPADHKMPEQPDPLACCDR